MKESSPGDHCGLFIAGTRNYRRNIVAPHDVLAVMVKDRCANIITALLILWPASSLLIFWIINSLTTPSGEPGRDAVSTSGASRR
jgi:hypothetical protein